MSCLYKRAMTAAAIAAAGLVANGAQAQTRMSNDPSFCEVYGALGGAGSERCSGASPGRAAAPSSPGGLTLQGTTQGIRPTGSALPGAAGAPPRAAAEPPKQAAASFGSITFRSGSAELTPQAISVLDTVAAVVNDAAMSNRTFVIEGHTDAAGDDSMNQALSERRAQAVVQYLTSRQVQPQRIQAVGKGETQLADPRNPTSQVNRRVVILSVRS